MKAVILAAGKGERLLPLTENRPKHLLPIGGRPLLEWCLRGLSEEGINDVLVVTNYMEGHIRSRFGDGSNLGLNIEYVTQKKMLGTADAFRVAENFVSGQDFIGIYGDLYVPPEVFGQLTKRHSPGNTILGVVPVDNPSQTGVVKLDGDRVTDIVEKPPPGEEPETHWVEIELLGEDDKPIPGETYRIQLPDGTLVKEGSVDMEGKARIDKIEDETCLVSFPNLGDESWDII